jgi:hypothetical protein
MRVRIRFLLALLRFELDPLCIDAGSSLRVAQAMDGAEIAWAVVWYEHVRLGNYVV